MLDTLIEILISDLNNNKYIKGIKKKILYFHIKKIVFYENNSKFSKKIFKLLKKKQQDKDFLKIKNNIKNNDNYKKLLKEIKKYFHKNYYSFLNINKDNKIYFLDFSNVDQNILKEYKYFLINSHKSTKERLDTIEQLKELFKKEVPNFFNKIEFNNIIDLGSGFNPLLLSDFLQFNKYIFIDINSLDVKLIQNLLLELYKKDKNKWFIGKDFDIYFEKKEILDFLKEIINKQNDIGAEKKINQIDNNLVVMLKLLDNLENNKKNFSLEFFKDLIKLGFNNFLISFSTKSFCGKDFNLRSRNWFINFLKKNRDFNFSYKTFNTKNEFFILIKVEN